MKGTIQVGDIQSFIQYVRSFTMPIQQVAQVANMLQSTAAASERVFEFLEEKEEDQTVENPVCIDKLEGSVSFDHVHFGYNPDHTIINDFSVDVKPGQKVAIVDDLIATGGSVEAAIKLVEELGGIVVKVVFLMELAGLKGRERLKGYDVASVICYDGK